MERFNQIFSGYYDYFESIRKRIYVLAVFFFAFFIAGFFGAGYILRAAVGVFDLQNAVIVTTSPFQFLDLATKIGLYTGLIFCLPLLIYQMYDFLKDGLSGKEKRLFFFLLPVGLILFAVGFAYGYGILFFYLNSVSGINLAFGLKNMWDISTFLSQVILTSALLGLVFQFPIILTFLIRAGLFDTAYLRKKRRFAIAIIFIFVGFLPPPDIFSTILEALPLVLIYEMTIWANSGYSARRAAQAEAAAAAGPEPLALKADQT